MRILVLFCGGTIVMTESESGALNMQEPEQAVQALLALEPKLAEVANLDVLYIDNIDSANMRPMHWDLMATAITERYDQYDGFVITHGTNSMAYTASALSFSLQNLGKPVVLTGAQIPCQRIETDARRNFVNAVRVATMDVAGVFLVFDEEIILGARSSKVSESRLDAFDTVNWDDVGEIRIQIRLADWRNRRHNKRVLLQNGFEDRVLTVNLAPGTPPEYLKQLLDSGIRGLILRGYGPGDIAYDYLPVLKKAREMRIPVVVDSQCLEGATLMHINDVGKQALDAGVIQAYDMSIECVTAKLMWALKHFSYESVKEVMHTNYTGEINVEGKIY